MASFWSRVAYVVAYVLVMYTFPVAVNYAMAAGMTIGMIYIYASFVFGYPVCTLCRKALEFIDPTLVADRRSIDLGAALREVWNDHIPDYWRNVQTMPGVFLHPNECDVACTLGCVLAGAATLVAIVYVVDLVNYLPGGRHMDSGAKVGDTRVTATTREEAPVTAPQLIK